MATRSSSIGRPEWVMIFHLTGDLNEDTGILGTKGRRVGKQKKGPRFKWLYFEGMKMS